MKTRLDLNLLKTMIIQKVEGYAKFEGRMKRMKKERKTQKIVALACFFTEIWILLVGLLFTEIWILYLFIAQIC